MVASEDNKEKAAEHIKEEISKSGFPLEIATATILDKHGWTVMPHLNFYLEERKERRELDVYAKKSNGAIQNTDNVLIIECKKQEENPWIFFEQDKPNRDVFTLNITPMNLYGWFEANLFSKHYYYDKKPCSYHFPSFVKHGKPDVILDAINQVLSALGFCWDMADELYLKLQDKRNSFFYPVIVLDGMLFSARVHSDGRIEPCESNHLQLKVTWALTAPLLVRYTAVRTIALSIKYFIIDIVRKDFFEEFLGRFH